MKDFRVLKKFFKVRWTAMKNPFNTQITVGRNVIVSRIYDIFRGTESNEFGGHRCVMRDFIGYRSKLNLRGR